ncbi:MAG: c-type cytochrome [Cyanophyceae cyanobacterium]
MLVWGLVSGEATAAETEAGAIFRVNCAGCHPHGGNIIRRGKNLHLRALHKNGVDSQEAIAFLVTHGKNNMPAYGERLSPEQIEAVSAYVLEQAQHRWR